MSTISVSLHQVRPTTAEVSIREHKLLVDRPESKGGGNWGAMGGELLLASLGGCFLSNLFEIVRTREADITKIRATVEGTLEGTPPRFTQIDLYVTGEYVTGEYVTGETRDADEFQKFVTMAERGCIVANTLKPALTLNIHIGEPARA